MPLLANYHTHTTLCDGADTPEAMAEEAFRRGFTHLGFSGHMDPDIHMDWAVYRAEIARLREVYRGRMEILCGVELDNLYDPACAPGAEYVIGSTHFIDAPRGPLLSVDASPADLRMLAEECFSGDYLRLSAAYYRLEAQVYDRTHCTFVGHFDLITRFNDDLRVIDEESPAYLGPALEAMEHLVRRGVPFEINCGAVSRGRKKELYPNRRLLRALRDFGGEIVISSDAHSKALLDGAFGLAVETAMACGFTHTNILTGGGSRPVRWQQIALDTL